MDDRQLLKQFTQHNSQEAFAALTARYLSLVYSTCRRELDDADLAEDVTQAVFLILARKAPSLRREVVLSGWLFQTARFAARNARLQETRRKAYEQKAAEAVMEQQRETEAAWNDIEPLLNQSLASLWDAERECVLLRFFQGMSFAEAGAALGLSEEAARKRVTRALGKMHRFFIKNGVIVPTTALALLLTTHAAKAAPAGLTPAIAQSTAGVLAGHTAAAALTGSHAYQFSEGVIKAMKIAQIKTAVGLTATATVIIGLSAYAVAHGMALTHTKTPQVAVSMAVPLPGHVLQQVPGRALTSSQIVEHCRQAYAALQSYQCTATVTGTFTSPANAPAWSKYNSAATIQYEKPGKFHAEGTDSNAGSWAYTTKGTAAEQMNLGKGWQRVAAVKLGSMMISTPLERVLHSGIVFSQNAGTIMPMVLVWSDERGSDHDDSFFAGILPETLLRKGGNTKIGEDTADGRLCYVLIDHLTLSSFTRTESVWIDEKTFMIHRIVTDAANPGNPAYEPHTDQRITNERLNQSIAESTFALPPAQGIYE